MHDVRYIEPGTETAADRLAAIRDLGLMALAAETEYEAIQDGALEKRGAGADGWHEDRAIDRMVAAHTALVLEIAEAETLGILPGIIAMLGHGAQPGRAE